MDLRTANGIQEVDGSIPFGSTKDSNTPPKWAAFLLSRPQLAESEQSRMRPARTLSEDRSRTLPRINRYTDSIVGLSVTSRSTIARLACLFLASRMALFAVGLASTWLLPSGAGVQSGNLVWHEPTVRPLEMWARWDSEWFLLIAAEGYDVGNHISRFAVNYEPSAAAGFLPLYPFLIHLLQPLFGPVLAGVLISNVCLFVSLLLLERLVRMEIDGEAGRVAGTAACVALLVFPSSFFLSAVYAESLFLMLSLAVFTCARRRHLAAAGFAGALATLTRPFGVLLVIPIVWEWWLSQHRKPDEEPLPNTKPWEILWAGLPLAALSGFLAFCHFTFGDPLALFHRQERWRGALSGPWRAFVRWWEAGPTAHGAHGSTIELVVAVVCVGMLVFMARRLRSSYTVYAAAGVTLALGSTLWSFSRIALPLFPFFMLIGAAWANGRRCLPALYAFTGAILSGLLVSLFANWWWAG